MKIRIYMSAAKYDWERDLLRRWKDGISRIEGKNVDVDFNYNDYPEKGVDVGIIYGGVRQTGKGVHDIRKSIIESSKTVIINETPLLGRTISKQFNWHRVGINSHLNGSGDFNSFNRDGYRLQTYKNEWNLKMRPWRSSGNHIILALQLPGDSSLRKQDISEWAINSINSLINVTDREIRIRTHPSFNNDDHYQIIDLYKYVCSLGNNRIKFSYGNIVPWDKDLENCYCLVSYSSGLSIDAVDSGIPVIAMDQGNFVYDISSHYVEEINNLKLASEPDKMQWYQSLSYSQWSTTEIEQGQVWNHLLPALRRKLES